MNGAKIATALRALADAFDVEQTVAKEITATEVPAAAATPRGRGRPPKVVEPETPAAAAPAAAPDPFAEVAATVVTTTLEDVRAALTGFRTTHGQDAALAILKMFAPDMSKLHASDFGKVVAAVKAVMPAVTPVVAEADPFETPAVDEAPPAKEVTLEEVRAAVVKAGKRTSQDTVGKVIMGLGGKKPNEQGVVMPSFGALPKDQYAAAIKAVEALPTTKT